MGWSLSMPARHENPDGSILVVAQLTDDDTGAVGELRLEAFPGDGNTQATARAFVAGDLGIVPLGMWDLQ